jgi:hypothetical protein
VIREELILRTPANPGRPTTRRSRLIESWIACLSAFELNNLSKVELLLLTEHNALAVALDKRTERMGKVLLSLREEALRTIVDEAVMRDISVQELLRAVVIPEWVRDNARRSVQTVVAAADPSRRQVFHRTNPRARAFRSTLSDSVQPGLF